jgi:subtilisin family serine protease
MQTLENDLKSNPAWDGLRLYGELLYEGQAPEGKSGSTWVGSTAPDGSYQTQYAINQIGLAQAQTQSIGDGTVVAILDAGVDTAHPALINRIAPGGYNFISNSPIVQDIGNGVNEDSDALTDEGVGHGTFVAGLIALAAPSAKILPITVLNTEGVGDGWLFAKGLFYAIDHGVEVINLSLSSTYDSMVVIDAIDEARCLGIVTVAAAGNFNADKPRQYPAMLDTPGIQCIHPSEVLAFGIAAVDENDIKADFSNFHKNLFISAPGASELTKPGVPNWNASTISTLPGGSFGSWEGTSMAVPLISGTVALIRAQHPEWDSEFSTWDAIRQILQDTAVDIYPLNPQYAADKQLGVGRIDIGAAVAQGPPAPRLGDINGDGSINIDDLLGIILDWGMIHSSADISGNGNVDIDDLLYLIRHWD